MITSGRIWQIVAVLLGSMAAEGTAFAQKANTFSSETAQRVPVLVELFTSEGCSSCPPADALLAKLRENHSNGAQLLLLGEHVDYWNGQGWNDRFSSPVFTQRQEDYARKLRLASAYTPQMMIDGRLDVVGNDERAVNASIAAAAKSGKPAAVLIERAGPHRFHISVDETSAGHAQVMLAVTEDELTTSVGGGENSGRTLHHAAVVRRLQVLGTTAQGMFRADAEVAPQATWKPENLILVVFVQDKDGSVLGGSSLKYQ